MPINSLDARVVVELNDLTPVLSNISMASTVDQIDDSVLEDYKEFISGQASHTVTASGRWTGTDGELDDYLADAVGREGDRLSVRIDRRTWKTGTVNVSEHSVETSNSGRVGCAGAWQMNEDGFVLMTELDEYAYTALTQRDGPEVDLGAAVGSKARDVWVYYLASSATKSGGSVQLRSSATAGGTYANEGTAQTFTAAQAATAITAGEPIKLSVTTDLLRYVKVRFTPTGTGTTGTVLILVDTSAP